VPAALQPFLGMTRFELVWPVNAQN
jgi:hypothetical protein